LAQRANHRQRRDDRVASRVLVEADDVSGVLAAEQPTLVLHHFQHVAVAHGAALQRNAAAVERLLEAEVAHQRADDAAGGGTAPPVVERDHVEQLVAVVDAPFGVDIIRRSPSPSSATPRSAPCSSTFACRCFGCVAPTPALMLMPSGSLPTATTSAPSSWNTGGATW